jgi:Na+-translocating ferredoxin:NAD+ oxidoreductase subunit A
MQEPNFWQEILTVMVSAPLINNFILIQFLGLCTFFGVSKKVEPSVGLGVAVIFVMGASSLLTAILWNFVMIPLRIEYMRIVVFIIVIAAFVQLVEIYTKKMMPALFKTLGVYLVITASNCAVLGAALQASNRYMYSVDLPLLSRLSHGILLPTFFGIASGAGFAIAIIALSYIRERLDLADVPDWIKGMPISFIATGLMAMAFMGFIGLIRG